MQRKIILIILNLFLTVSCAQTNSPILNTETFSYSSEEISQISIKMYSGEIEIGNSSSDIVIVASLENIELITMERDGENLVVEMNNSSNYEKITMQIPEGIELAIESFDAEMVITDINGIVEARSTAGDIRVDNFCGTAKLWAGRGNIGISHGCGEIFATGEHGQLSVSDFNGDVLMSTIMGSLKYHHHGQVNGVIQLETDHGPVEVNLIESANLSLILKTVSGYVTCIGEKLVKTINGCEGKIGDGSGNLTIRTVSGNVDVRVVSDIQEESND